MDSNLGGAMQQLRRDSAVREMAEAVQQTGRVGVM
jgi:hypothetical protein